MRRSKVIVVLDQRVFRRKHKKPHHFTLGAVFNPLGHGRSPWWLFRRRRGVVCWARGVHPRVPLRVVHDPETEVQLRHPDRAFTGSRELTSDAWQARVLEVGSAHGNLPGDAEGSTLPTSEVIIGPDRSELARVLPIGTFHGPWARRQRAGGVPTNAPST